MIFGKPSLLLPTLNLSFLPQSKTNADSINAGMNRTKLQTMLNERFIQNSFERHLKANSHPQIV
jgi:hypothetical protein